jgi:hypothetical protein
MNPISKFTSTDGVSGISPLLSKSSSLVETPLRTKRGIQTEVPSFAFSSEQVFVTREDAYFYFDEI